jgi:hypothetical protein
MLRARTVSLDHPDVPHGVAGTILGRTAETLLWQSGYLALRGVTCEVDDGELCLRGSLPTYYLKQMAQELVSKVEGVRRVINQIEVSGADLERVPLELRSESKVDSLDRMRDPAVKHTSQIIPDAAFPNRSGFSGTVQGNRHRRGSHQPAALRLSDFFRSRVLFFLLFFSGSKSRIHSNLKLRPLKSGS